MLPFSVTYMIVYQRVFAGDNMGWKIGLDHFEIILGKGNRPLDMRSPN